jgi:hypothetical protein
MRDVGVLLAIAVQQLSSILFIDHSKLWWQI